MKGIMFNTKYGLEQAVLREDKTRTWRADKKPTYISFDDMRSNFCVIHSPECPCGKEVPE